MYMLCGFLLAYFRNASASLVPFPSIQITLSSYFDNHAASIDGTTDNFNNKGSTYAAEYLPRTLVRQWRDGKCLCCLRDSCGATRPLRTSNTSHLNAGVSFKVDYFSKAVYDVTAFVGLSSNS